MSKKINNQVKESMPLKGEVIPEEEIIEVKDGLFAKVKNKVKHIDYKRGVKNGIKTAVVAGVCYGVGYLCGKKSSTSDEFEGELKLLEGGITDEIIDAEDL